MIKRSAASAAAMMALAFSAPAYAGNNEGSIQIKAFAFVHALGNVRALTINGGQDGARLVVEADVRVVVTDTAHRVLCDFAVVDVGRGGDFTRDHDEAGRHQRFAGNTGFRVFGQDGVEDGIRDLIRNFIGMAFRD